MNKLIWCAMLVVAGAIAASGAALAKGSKVSETGNKHNLSSLAWNSGNTVANTNVYMADPSSVKGQQICIFCHTPHSAQPQSTLWNRNYGTTFYRYSSSTLMIRGMDAANYRASGLRQATLNGPSKLCLGCHDGSNLGAVLRGGNIKMLPGRENITGNALFNEKKMKIGHHPVSFTYDNAVVSQLTGKIGVYGGTYKLPNSYVAGMYSSSMVKIDKRSGKMECTTCHDPHQNQSDDTAFYPAPNDTRKVAPFWVYGGSPAGGTKAYDDHDFVCMTCHQFSNSEVPGGSKPWSPP